MFEQMREKITSKTAATLALASLAVGLTGCVQSNAPQAEGAVADRLDPSMREQTKAARLAEVKDVGEGVFVFPRSAAFPETLADFRKAHPEYKLISVTQGPDQTSGVLDQTDSRANSMLVVVEQVSTNR